MFFDGVGIDPAPGANRLPTIAVGMDINDLAEVTRRHVRPGLLKLMETGGQGEVCEPDAQAINADLARLPTDPDENLQ